MDDRNADLIGYEYEIPGDPPTRWQVTGTDEVCGPGYVRLVCVGGEGVRVQNAATIRRRKQIEAETMQVKAGS